ncbi:MAG TPA: CBS domain-containing protein [Pseudonocardiaceae bacterium]
MNIATILDGPLRGRPVQTIGPDEPVRVAVRRMTGPPTIGSLVVCRPGQRRVIGLITERDIVRGLGQRGAGMLDTPVSNVMSSGVPLCRRDDSIRFAMAEMTRTRFRHLPVVDNGALVGLVSIGDVVKNRLQEMETETAVLRDLYIAGR